VEAVLLWQIARMAAVQPVFVRPMVAVFVAANIGHALLLTRYFKFPLPIAFDLLIAALLVAALVAAHAGPGLLRAN
jgi:hypothetical protein